MTGIAAPPVLVSVLLPSLIERLLLAYRAQREARETFVDFARRHRIDALRALAGVTGS